MITETIHGKLIAERKGLYHTYVFEITSDKFIMCTKLPNWGYYDIKIGDSGFLTYEIAIAGESYYDRNSDENNKYKFSNIYFKDFIKDSDYAKELIL